MVNAAADVGHCDFVCAFRNEQGGETGGPDTRPGFLVNMADLGGMRSEQQSRWCIAGVVAQGPISRTG